MFVLAFLLILPGHVAHAGFEVGKQAYDSGDFAAALKELAPLAKKGDPRAQHILGHMYRHGRGVEADIVKGTTWLLYAAQKGYVHAQYDLGLIFRNMAVTKGQFAKAVKWLLAASKQGHVEAQYQLGRMYRDGYGVEADNVKALVLFKAAGKRMKLARGPRDQLRKRMTKAEIAKANLGMSLFSEPAKIKTFAESKTTDKTVRGKCGRAGKDVYLFSIKLEELAAILASCVGEEWTGDLCTTQKNDLNKTYKQLNDAAELMKKHC